jgi:hypothetical protein
VWSCTRPFDDYLALRGGSVESAIRGAVEKAIAPLVKASLERLRPRIVYWTDRTEMVPATYSRSAS